VLQGRTFQRLGETETRHFSGKIVAATNRNLAEEMAAGRFREDFYYRLCADQIQTPSLASQLSGPGDELPHLVGHIANQVAGPELGPQITDEAVTWIRKNLPKTYTWPGNFRELEQCVRNIMIGGSYQPRTTTSDTSNSWRLAQQGRLSADALLAFYCQQVYQQLGSYTATADALGLDRRTVKAKVTAAEQTQE
jgi:DNA-binding NtrC family response regulator